MGPFHHITVLLISEQEKASFLDAGVVFTRVTHRAGFERYRLDLDNQRDRQLAWRFYGRKLLEAPSHELHWQPSIADCCTKRTIKIYGSRIPVQHLPVHAVAVLFMGDRG